jgi:hypothetical protein
LTPNTNIGVSSFDGADRITFFAPASRCFCAVALSRNDDFGAHFVPFQHRGIALLGQTDLVAVDDQMVAVHRNLALEAPMHRVVLKHVGQVIGLQQVVDGDDLDVAAEVLHRRAQHVAADAAEAIDANLDRHAALLLKTWTGKAGILATSRACFNPRS